MTISSVMQAGLSALAASQAGLKVASQNIANANTPGYVRTEVTFSPLINLGEGGGVQVSSVQRAADRFLATAAFIAQATQGAASARSDLLARAQTYFGDPTSDTSVFASLDDVWSSLTDLQVDPSSTLSRDQAVSSLSTALGNISQTAASIQSLISEADERIGTVVDQAQSLLTQISDLNDQIRLTKRAGADASGVENAQSSLIDQLSSLMDLRIEQRPEGGVTVRTSGGALLVGSTAAKITYTPNSGAFATHGVISLNSDLGTQSNLEPYLSGGEISGLLQARDKDLPALADALGGFVGALSDKLNAIHNENASTPAASNLTGRQTGLLSTDALNFSGKAIIGLTDSSGALAQRLTIDFGARTITGEAPAGVFSFSGNTIGAFATAMNAALAAATPAGSASFSGGKLSLDVGGGGGLVVQQDPTNGADRAGRGFSHFFGLNDLTSRPTPMFFDVGASASDLHGLSSGGQISFQVKDAAGRIAATRTISISGALAGPTSTWGDLINALNATGTGLGEYATFALDSNGKISMTPKGGFQTNLQADSTARGATGVSFSGLFGLSNAATAGRALEASVSTPIANDPGLLAVGRPDLTAAIGARIIEAGDNRGAAALANARDAVYTFPAAGVLSAQSTTLGLYASRLGGTAGRIATQAAQDATGAAAVSAAASDRRAQVESVNLDDELIRMTTYQNSYAAAARVIQAAKDMFDVLFSIGAN